MYSKKIVNGYYTTTAHYGKRLEYCPNGSAGVDTYDGYTHLISYTTRVISIDAEGWLECTGTYSATTRKHIGAFLKEYAPNLCYQDVKAACNGNYEININTGEIRPLP